MLLTCNECNGSYIVDFSKKKTVVFNVYKNKVESFIQFQEFDYIFQNKFKLRV